MRYKESKYTFKTKDNDGNFLMYNTAHGMNSLLCVEKSDTEKYNSLIENAGVVNDTIINKLLNKGIIVAENVDEDSVLRRLYIETRGESVLTLIINPTEQCNFRCKYCYENYKEGLMSQETQDRIVEFVEKNISKYTGLRIMWFGGEPLLGLKVIRNLSSELIRICKKHKRTYYSQMTTNGYLLSYDTYLELIKLHVMTYQITVDGIKDIHDSQRVYVNNEGTFDTIYNNLKAIKLGKKYPVQIVLRTNFTCSLYERMDEYIESFCNEFKDDKRFSFDIHLVGNWLGKADSAIIDDIGEVNLYQKIYKKLLCHPNGNINLTTIFMNPGGRVCAAAKKNSYMISSDGTIHKCTLNFESSDSVLGELTCNGNMCINAEKSAEWIGVWDYCKSQNDCYLAPLCFGDHCPLPKTDGKRICGELYCPEIKLYMDVYLKCLNRHDKFEKLKF